MWTLASISMSWIFTNLKRKTENVHCQNVDHKHQDRNPRLCHIGSEFHKESYYECLKSLEDIASHEGQSPTSSLGISQM